MQGFDTFNENFMNENFMNVFDTLPDENHKPILKISLLIEKTAFFDTVFMSNEEVVEFAKKYLPQYYDSIKAKVTSQENLH